jgi:hypothetical protein
MESENVMPEVQSGTVLTMNVTGIIKGLAELGSLAIEDFNLNLAISQTVSKLSPVEKAFIKSAQALMKNHIEVSESGVPITEGEGTFRAYVYKSVKDKEDYLSKMDELNNKEVKVELKLKTSQLKDVKGLRAITMMKLGALIEDDLSIT